LLLLIDEEHTLRGKQGQSRKDLLRRWRQAHAQVEVLVRISGVCRPAELARQSADRQRQKKTGQRSCPWCHEGNDVTFGHTLCTK
jgi:hypothetical protein